jgi:hypothetical protein
MQEACPATNTSRTPGRAAKPNLAGSRDKALLLVGFVAALGRSDLVALEFENVNEHPPGGPVPLVGRAVAPSPTGEGFGFSAAPLLLACLRLVRRLRLRES